jgi:hypothetical protein
MNSYPMLDLVGRHGGWFAVVLALVPLAGSAAALAMGFSAWWLAAGSAAGVLVFIVARSYVELIRVMIDMLLPK